jgi:predicted dinucleotide-binding enzyme
MKKIGIIGSGMVGQTLAKAFVQEGHDVMLGTRDISKVEPIDGVKIAEMADVASFGHILVHAVKGRAAVESLQGLDIDGKIIIDANNPIADIPPKDGVLRFFTNQNESLIGQLQNTYPKAKFVKAFNSVGSGLMYKPALESKPTMFICGNDLEAKKEVTSILDTFGWEAIYGHYRSRSRHRKPMHALVYTRL